MIDVTHMTLKKLKSPCKAVLLLDVASMRKEGFSLLGDIYFSGHEWKAVMGRGRIRWR